MDGHYSSPGSKLSSSGSDVSKRLISSEKPQSERKSRQVPERVPKGSKFSHKCDKVTQGFWRNFSSVCPPIDRLLKSDPDEFVAFKFIFGFPCGIGLGLLIYHGVLEKMDLPEIVTFAMGGAFTLALGMGFAATSQVRCIALLVMPTFCGKSGRSYVGTFAIALLISGPMTNMVFNAKEVVRALSCTSKLAVNQSKAHLELRFKPLHDIMTDMERQGLSMSRVTVKIKQAFYPVEKEVDDTEETEELKQRTRLFDTQVDDLTSRVDAIKNKYRTSQSDPEEVKNEKKYEEKLDFRCEDINSKGVETCKQMFREAEEKCKKKIKFVGNLLCLPLKLTIFCKLVNSLPTLGDKGCNALDAVNDGFGEGYTTAKKSANNMGEEFEVNMQYKVIVNEDNRVDVRTPSEAAKEVAYEFSWRQRWIKFFMTLVRRLLAFMFLRVIFSAHKYHKNYVSNFHHDNTYITTYFRHIDARRHAQNKRTLLPLKKIERKEIMEPLSLRMNKKEKLKAKRRSVMLVVRLFMFTMVILVDSILYEILDLISRHAHMDFRQTGSHHVALIIQGKSVLGELFRSILSAVNAKHTIDNLTTNKECLPRPSSTPVTSIISIYVVFLVSWLLVLLESYGLRLRPVIAGFFYRKRQKKRIIYLYNDMLKKRKGFLKHARNVIMRKAREQKLYLKTSILEALKRQFPDLCSCLSRFRSSRSKCLICEEKETEGYVRCPTPGCVFGYCAECWVDIKRDCYACRLPEDWLSDSSLSSDDNM